MNALLIIGFGIRFHEGWPDRIIVIACARKYAAYNKTHTIANLCGEYESLPGCNFVEPFAAATDHSLCFHTCSENQVFRSAIFLLEFQIICNLATF